MKGMNSYIVR